jgi:flagellar hook-length control protein FliK
MISIDKEKISHYKRKTNKRTNPTHSSSNRNNRNNSSRIKTKVDFLLRKTCSSLYTESHFVERAKNLFF